MLDDIIAFLIGAIASGGGAILYLHFKNTVVSVGIEPTYIEGRGDRAPHVHHYDTMDTATKGRFVCGTCRKAAPR